MNIIPKLESIGKQDDNMGILANYLLEYDGDFNNLKIQHICDTLYISVASATRLAKKLDLSGFSELKIQLIQERSENKISQNKYLDISTNKYYEDICTALSNTLEGVDINYIQKISFEMTKVKKVVFFSIGGSTVSLTDFAYKLQRLKIQTSLYSDYHMQYVEAMNADADVLCIGLTYSGLTEEVLHCLNIAQGNKAKTLMITSNEELINDKFDHFILINASKNTTRTYSISSRISTLSILDLIYLSIIESNPDYYNKLLFENRFIK